MRTPLSVLKVQVALARRGSDAERREALDEIADAVTRLERLVTQLLALARAEEAGVSAPLEAVDLREVATRVITRQFGHAVDAGIDLTLDGDAPVVSGHRTLIFEILANLVDNGIRYNRPGGTVAITIDATPAGTRVTVRDDGPGIPRQHRDTAFERFVRLGNDGSDGSGLGLAIVRSAAARLGATVAFGESAQGLAVILHFPRLAG